MVGVGWFAITVRDTRLLTARPWVLFTTTWNVAPLSARVVDGITYDLGRRPRDRPPVRAATGTTGDAAAGHDAEGRLLTDIDRQTDRLLRDEGRTSGVGVGMGWWASGWESESAWE